MILASNKHNEFHKITVDGIYSLLNTAINLDSDFQNIPASNDIEAKTKLEYFLDNTFIGHYYARRKKMPIYLQNAININHHIYYIESTTETNELMMIYQKLLAYSNFIEINDSFVLMGNCLEYIKADGKLTDFNFNIYNDTHSARGKYNKLKKTFDSINNKHIILTLEPFNELLTKSDYIFDRQLRNSIAHCSYCLNKDARILIYYKGSVPEVYSFDNIHKKYQSAFSYISGFSDGVHSFTENLIPNYPYYPSPIKRW